MDGKGNRDESRKQFRVLVWKIEREREVIFSEQDCFWKNELGEEARELGLTMMSLCYL